VVGLIHDDQVEVAEPLQPWHAGDGLNTGDHDGAVVLVQSGLDDPDGRPGVDRQQLGAGLLEQLVAVGDHQDAAVPLHQRSSQMGEQDGLAQPGGQLHQHPPQSAPEATPDRIGRLELVRPQLQGRGDRCTSRGEHGHGEPPRRKVPTALSANGCGGEAEDPQPAATTGS
jgi:hypothetical protein